MNLRNCGIGNYWERQKERGAAIIATAFSVPLMMIGGVAAVDLGAYWSHATELQNAADAAALAGAAAFVRHKNTLEAHNEADAEADRYVGININDDENMVYTKYKKNSPVYGVAEKTAAVDAKGADKYKGYIYYRVRLKDTCPSYFIKFFGLNDPAIEVSATAQIAASRHEPSDVPLTDLFMVKNGFDVVNTIENPDTFRRNDNGGENITGGIQASFDGQVSYLTKGLTDSVLSGSQQLGICPFYTSAALEKNKTVSNYTFFMDPYKGTPASFDEEGNMLYDNALYTYPHYKEYSMEDEFVAVMKDKVDKYAGEPVGSSSQYFSVRDNLPLFNNDVVYVTSQVQNLTLNIDTALPGSDSNDKHRPLFLYVDETVSGLVKINVTHGNGRPLIICAPTAHQVELDISGDGNIENINNERFDNTKDAGADVIGSGNNIFRGVICAPNAYMLCHPNGGGVLGTIMTDFLKLDGYGRYKYENFSFGGDGKGSTQSVDVDFDSQIMLIAPPADVTWREN